MAFNTATANQSNKQKVYYNLMQEFPSLKPLIKYKIIPYNLSLQDLFNAGLVINQEEESADFSLLALTSIDGLEYCPPMLD